MAKHNLRELDEGQLQMMWNFLKLQRKNTCTKEDVRILKEHIDIIRQAMVQKTAGQRDTDPDTYVDFVDIGTYIRIGMVQRNFLLRLIILMGKCKHFSTEAVEKAHWFILETL